MKDSPKKTRRCSSVLGFFGNKKCLAAVSVTVVLATVIGLTSAFVLAVSDAGNAAPVLAVKEGLSRLTSPFAGADTSLPGTSVSPYRSTAVTGAIPPRSVETEAVTEEEYAILTAPSLSALSPKVETETETEIAVETVAETEAVTEVETEVETEAVTEVETEVETETEPEPEPEPEPEEYGVIEPFKVNGKEITLPYFPDYHYADVFGVEYTVKGPKWLVTSREIYYVATVVQLEVMGHGSSIYGFEDVKTKYFEMLSVAQCIRNRMESPRFPSSAYDVIFQCGKNGTGNFVYQFYSEDILTQYGPSYEAIMAAYDVLVRGVTVLPTNYYYFCATRICKYFEKTNVDVFNRYEDGSFDKITSDLTTFYGGNY